MLHPIGSLSLSGIYLALRSMVPGFHFTRWQKIGHEISNNGISPIGVASEGENGA